ncbi:MAG: DNA polymerase III subunit alpha, partial [Bacteroidia bacterium]|nr:DNA polymerase III subunit alpha [Bacteroidia bacterium]
DKLAKLVPEVPGITLDQAFRDVKELREAKTSKDKTTRETLEFAKTLEGSARHTGIHAAGVIIAPGDLMEYLPVSTAKDSDLWVTQYDGKYVESVGMLKMDFLGLKTLTIIKDAIDIIKENRNVTIDIEKIPLDDEKTFELYQKGDTIGTFQFESNGMRQYLKDLKPTSIEDLIAMNALFRPGPMDFIPQFIDCKHGRKKIEYPHPLLEGILKNTYGIMVYQEQIMQTAQIMGGFSLGAADILRRAMGKKKASVMDEQREVFIKGAAEKNIEKKKAEEVFDVMAKFAEYGFNRSHSAAYSVLAYQTGYLKAHYPAEYMAAVLTNNMQDIKKVTYFIEESKRQGIPVLGPDVNESNIKFTVNNKGEIRFGLAALKGVGSLAAEQVIVERRENGAYHDIIDMVSRVNLRTVNKRSIESLIKSGAFDSFEGFHRAQYLHVHGHDEASSLDKIIRTGSQIQRDKENNQHSLFGESIDIPIVKPTLPECEPWSELEKLRIEKEVAGIYFSGHPLDMYRYEMMHFCNINTSLLEDLKKLENKSFSFGGIITEVSHRLTKTGRPFGSFTLEDYSDSFNTALFGESYLKFKHLLVKENFLHITATVKPGWRDNGSLELKITNMQLLSEVGSKMARKFTLKVDANQVDEANIEKLEKILISHKGKIPVKFNLIDKEDKYSVFAGSKNIKVKYNQELMEILDATSGIDYSIN